MDVVNGKFCEFEIQTLQCLIGFTEPFKDDGTLESDVFLDTIGLQYIAIALNAAHKADPNALMYINEFNIEFPGMQLSVMAS